MKDRKTILPEWVYLLIILGLLGFVGYQIWQARIQNEFRFAESYRFNELLQLRKGEILKRDTVIALYADSAKDRRGKNLEVLKRKETAKSEKTAKLAIVEKPILLLADTNAIVREYVEAVHDLQAANDTLVYEMTLRHKAELVDADRIIELQAKQILDLHTVTATLEDRNKVLEANSVKDKRKIRARDYIIGGAVAFIVLQIVTK